MSDEEGSQKTDQYSSDLGEEDDANELDLEDEAQGDQDEEQELELLEGADESDDDDDADSDSDDSDDEEDEEADQDAEGDEDDDGDLEAALGGMESMEPLDENMPDIQMTDMNQPPLAEVPIPAARPATPSRIRRGLFVTKPPYPRTWTIEPICAIPHPVATHCLASSTCMTYLVTGSDDGFIRCYDFFAGVNGKTYLTAPQRHHCGIGEGTMKAGVLKTWWENPSPAPQQPHDGDDKNMSPVHSMVLQGDALWGLSGTSTGQINLFTVRHDPGRIHHVFNAHRGPVSGLVLPSDESGAFSAGWDGEAKQWDLNTGQLVRAFPSHGAQVVSLGLRPIPQGGHLPAVSDVFGAQEVNGIGSSIDRDRDEADESGSSQNSLFGDDSGDEDDNAVKQSKSKAPLNGFGRSKGSVLYSPDVLMTAYIDGQVKLWDRRSPSQTGKLQMGEKCPPWCVSACWAWNGYEIYAGRRNGTIDVWDMRQSGPSARGGPKLVKSLRNPASSGPVSCVVGFPDGQHLACASQDNIRLWKVSDDHSADQHRRTAPFKIIAGHHGGIISQILVDSSSRFMITASGNRGWFAGESTKTVLVHDLKAVF